MIYTQWEDVVGKTIEKFETYRKEDWGSDTKKEWSPYITEQWDVLFFADGVVIQQYLTEQYEPSDLEFVDTVNKKMPQEVIDIIEKYK